MPGRTLQGCVNWNQHLYSLDIANFMSHPSGVRELKLVLFWITRRKIRSHPSGVRELKRAFGILYKTYLKRRTLQGCVNWNSNSSPSLSLNNGRTLQGCVNWNISIICLHCKTCIVAPFRGAWIETFYWKYGMNKVDVAPFRGAWIETCKNWANCA